MGGKPRVPKVDEACAAAAAGVKMAELRVAALHFACRELRDRSRADRDPAMEDFSALHSALYRELNEKWRILAMWGTMHPNEATKKRIAQLVWKQYLKEGMVIMGYLDPSNICPSRWLGETEGSFRDDLNKLADYLDIPEKDRSR